MAPGQLSGTVLRLRVVLLVAVLVAAVTHDGGSYAVWWLASLVTLDAAGTALWLVVRRQRRTTAGPATGPAAPEGPTAPAGPTAPTAPAGPTAPAAPAAPAVAPAAPESVLLRAVCHEFRAPVSSLGSLTRALNDEDRMAAPTIRRQIARLAHDQAVHLDDLLRQAAAASQGLTVAGATRPVPLDHVLPGAVTVVPHGRLRLTVAPEAARCPVDAARMRHILTNLLENAVRHGPPRGVVRLSAATGPRGLHISVADEGELTADLRQALSRPEPPAGMSGLGLWVVRRLVAAHGGRVAARALAGRGVAVDVVLPADAGGHPPTGLGAVAGI